MQNEQQLNPEQLRFENELLKLKLQAEYGAIFPEDHISALPPEIEHEFLKNILSDQHPDSKPVSFRVYDFIGKPDYQHWELLSPDLIAGENNKLLQLLEKHAIHITFNFEVSEEEKYRFITEDIFDEEILYYYLPGWYYEFIYEEFYPNYEEDMKHDTTLTLYTLIDTRPLDEDELLFFLNDEIKEQFLQRFKAFHESFDKLEIVSLYLNDPELDEYLFSPPEGTSAKVQFELKFKGVPEDSSEEIEHELFGEFGYVFREDSFLISRIFLPGIVE
jgi:hypothetical protein